MTTMQDMLTDPDANGIYRRIVCHTNGLGADLPDNVKPTADWELNANHHAYRARLVEPGRTGYKCQCTAFFDDLNQPQPLQNVPPPP